MEIVVNARSIFSKLIGFVLVLIFFVQITFAAGPPRRPAVRLKPGVEAIKKSQFDLRTELEHVNNLLAMYDIEGESLPKSALLQLRERKKDLETQLGLVTSESVLKERLCRPPLYFQRLYLSSKGKKSRSADEVRQPAAVDRASPDFRAMLDRAEILPISEKWLKNLKQNLSEPPDLLGDLAARADREHERFVADLYEADLQTRKIVLEFYEKSVKNPQYLKAIIDGLPQESIIFARLKSEEGTKRDKDKEAQRATATFIDVYIPLDNWTVLLHLIPENFYGTVNPLLQFEILKWRETDFPLKNIPKKFN